MLIKKLKKECEKGLQNIGTWCEKAEDAAQNIENKELYKIATIHSVSTKFWDWHYKKYLRERNDTFIV